MEWSVLVLVLVAYRLYTAYGYNRPGGRWLPYCDTAYCATPASGLTSNHSRASALYLHLCKHKERSRAAHHHHMRARRQSQLSQL
eukprot:scaffold14591_cov140-Isochrysis_galbana.AAC.4